MKNIAKNLILGKNLEKTYNKLADLLGEKGLFIEQCYTYESVCRLLNDSKKIEKYNKKVMKINLASCKNSFNRYIMSNTPIANEFSTIKTNKSTDILLSYVDRYLALIHLLMIVFEYNDILKISSSSAPIKEKIDFMLKYVDKELAAHIKKVISNEEYRLAEMLSADIFNHIKVLELTIKYGYTDKELFEKILSFYYCNQEYTEALNFYNEVYALVFDLPLLNSTDDLNCVMSNKDAS